MSYKATCMKERKEVTVKNPKFVVMGNCNAAVRGECPNCGTTVQRIIPKDAAPADIRAKLEECKRKKPAKSSKKGKSGGSKKSKKSGGAKSKKSKKSHKSKK